MQNISIRSWHAWLGVMLSIPIIIVGITAIFLSHGKELGLKDVAVNFSWLPGYWQPKESKAQLDIRSTYLTKDGHYFIATRQGLYSQDNNGMMRIEDLPLTEFRSIQETPNGLLVAGKEGVWIKKDSHWQKIYSKEAWTAEASANQIIRIAVPKRGLLESQDGGKKWKPLTKINKSLSKLILKAPEEKMNLGQLMFDLHTGRAFFGRPMSWIWIDLIGLTITFLTLSGVLLWRRGQKLKSQLQE